MPFVSEMQTALPFIAQLDEHRQRAIATFASHMIGRAEEDATMTEAEIVELRRLEREGRSQWLDAMIAKWERRAKGDWS
jgi:hypothetical protein